MLVRYRRRSPRVTAVLREEDDLYLGKVVAVTETVGRGTWTTYLAYDANGHQVGSGSTLVRAAEWLGAR
jgi:hypothetical protein